MRSPSVLVVHDHPEEFRDALAARFPDLRIAYATQGSEVVPALEAVQPEAVLSIKYAGFPGSAHRPVVDWPSVRWVQVGGSGFDHFLPWDPGRVTLTNCAGILAHFLAETVVGAILALNRGFFTYRDHQRARSWTQIAFRPLQDQTLLVVGVGAIGGEVARLAKAIGMRVIGVRRGGEAHPSVDTMYRFADLGRVLPEADIVSLHLRAAPETANLFDAGTFAAMKPGAHFVNTSRGAVVDEPALVRALASGHLGAAYLDVFAEEPLPAASPLWAMDNVFLTPHASDNVGDWTRRFAAFFADNLERYRRGEPLLKVVRPD